MPSRSRATQRYVVAVSGDSTSPGTLRWIDAHVPIDSTVLVVHATDQAIVVRNGPSRAAAAKMNGAPWTRIATIAEDALDHEHETIVDHGSVVDVLARHAEPTDVVLVGHVRRSRRRANLAGEIHARTGAPVLAIDPDGDVTLLSGIEAPETERLTHAPDEPATASPVASSASDQVERVRVM